MYKIYIFKFIEIIRKLSIFFFIIGFILLFYSIFFINQLDDAGSPMQNLKNFANAMSLYLKDNQVYPKDKFTFSDYYSHIDTKRGYFYQYYSDSLKKHYIYLTFPLSVKYGNKAYLLTNTNKIYQSLVNYKSIAILENFSNSQEKKYSISSLDWHSDNPLNTIKNEFNWELYSYGITKLDLIEWKDYIKTIKLDWFKIFLVSLTLVLYGMIAFIIATTLKKRIKLRKNDDSKESPFS